VVDHQRFLSGAAKIYQESAIRKTGALAATVPDLISFAAGYPAAEMFPWAQLQELTAELLAGHDGNTLQYGATRGYRPLIEQVIALLATRGVAATHADLVITTGSQQGLDLSGRVLIDPGDVVLVELPTYSGAIAAFHNLQAELAGVSQDAEGITIDGLDEAVARVRATGKRPRFVYVTPNFQNPAGMLMSAARRVQLLEAATRHDLLILEDDPYGSLYFEDTTRLEDTRPIKADDVEGRVIYLGSISKTLVPGFRVAWMVAPPPIASRVELAKQATDLCSGVFDQRVVHACLARGVVESIAPSLRAHYQEKCAVMEAALRDAMDGRVRWIRPRGGFFLWAEFPDGIDDRELFTQAVGERVSFVIGSAFFVDGGGHRYARLSFSNPSPDRIREGIARLKRALDKVPVLS